MIQKKIKLNISDFTGEELVNAIANWIDKETSGDNCGLADDIRSGYWLEDLEEELNDPRNN